MDGNWKRMSGSKLKTTTIKTNLSHPSHFLKNQAKYHNISKSSAAVNSNNQREGQYTNLNMSREVSIIDLQLPVKSADQTNQRKRLNLTGTYSSNHTDHCHESEACTTNTFASRLTSLSIKQASNIRLPSPIGSENNESNHQSVQRGSLNSTEANFHVNAANFEKQVEYDTTISNRNRNYIQYVINQQKKRQFMGVSSGLNNKRSINFYNQDISVGSGLNNISTNSLLIRRLKF